MKKLILTAIAAFAAAAPAIAEERFSHNGETYVYTAKEANGRTVLEGRRLSTGSKFRLVVLGNTVTGQSGGVPVAFKAPATSIAPIATAQR